MDFHKLFEQSGQWLQGAGPESDIVISSRIRLARNLQGHKFCTRAADAESGKIFDRIAAVVTKDGFAEKLQAECVRDLPPLYRQFLVERHLISKELSKSNLKTGLVFNTRESIGIMVNEEDHLRIQTINSGLQLETCWQTAAAVDDWLEQNLEFAFSPRFGYLTACPTNVGTGLRASVMLHLPALAMTSQIDKIFHALSKLNLVVRGLFGEGTSALGDFYQISNQATLNRDEPGIMETIHRIIPQILQYERSIRQNLLKEQSSSLQDKIWRSLGILKNARRLQSEEALDCLSAVRLGINLGVLPDIEIHTVNDLFILSQPAHLRMLHGGMQEDADIEALRADVMRARLKDGGKA